MSKYMNNAEAKLFYEGKIYPTTKFGDVTIVEYRERRSIDIVFNRTNVRRTCTLGQVLTGKLRDRAQTSVYGVGILGEHFTKVNGKFTREYELWSGMLERCWCRVWFWVLLPESLSDKCRGVVNVSVDPLSRYLPFRE